MFIATHPHTHEHSSSSSTRWRQKQQYAFKWVYLWHTMCSDWNENQSCFLFKHIFSRPWQYNIQSFNIKKILIDQKISSLFILVHQCPSSQNCRTFWFQFAFQLICIFKTNFFFGLLLLVGQNDQTNCLPIVFTTKHFRFQVCVCVYSTFNFRVRLLQFYSQPLVCARKPITFVRFSMISTLKLYWF